VRPLRPDDVPRLVEINAAEEPAVGPIDVAGLEHLVGESVVSLVATTVEGGDDPVGFCVVLGPGADYGSVNYRWFADRYDDFVYLDRVAVAPAAQGRGLGRALYEEVERLVDAEWFTLEVNLRPRNDPSLAFHARLGFEEVGRQETPYGSLVSLMAKRLRPSD
jgi:predicted GNAT superfamily acetyltransferase